MIHQPEDPGVFSCGDCPVEPGASYVIVLKRRLGGGLVYCCFACGCAWENPPGERIDSINALPDLAPEGVELLTRAEGRALGLEELDDFAHWMGLSKGIYPGHSLHASGPSIRCVG